MSWGSLTHDHYFANDTILKYIFLNENDHDYIGIQLALKYVPNGPSWKYVSHWFRQVIAWTNDDTDLWFHMSVIMPQWKQYI